MITPEQMAALHDRAFAGQGRAWVAQEFAELLQSPHVFAVGDAQSFALGRVIVDEAELLTIATDPRQQRQGQGRVNLRGFEAEARRRGASAAFLEVACDNSAALALYLDEGYVQVARREGYYTQSDGGRVDALILQKSAF